MGLELAQSLMSLRTPRGLARFTLYLLAVNAGPDDRVPFGEAEQERLALELSMRVDRFQRNVRALLAEGCVSVDDGTLAIHNGGQGVAVVSPSTTATQQTSLLSGTASDQGSVREDSDSRKVRTPASEVLDFYAHTFEIKNPKWGEDDRRLVRAALEIKSVPELKKAIQGNKLSGFHQGENDRRKKYNTLGHILRGKQGKKTQRENIDYFIGVFEQVKGSGGSVVDRDADPAIVATRKEEIRRAHRIPDDEEAQERGRRAEVWLEERGIKTHRRGDGYPIWTQGDPE